MGQNDVCVYRHGEFPRSCFELVVVCVLIPIELTHSWTRVNAVRLCTFKKVIVSLSRVVTCHVVRRLPPALSSPVTRQIDFKGPISPVEVDCLFVRLPGFWVFSVRYPPFIPRQRPQFLTVATVSRISNGFSHFHQLRKENWSPWRRRTNCGEQHLAHLPREAWRTRRESF